MMEVGKSEGFFGVEIPNMKKSIQNRNVSGSWEGDVTGYVYVNRLFIVCIDHFCNTCTVYVQIYIYIHIYILYTYYIYIYTYMRINSYTK